MNKIKGLDGLRGLSVLAVIFSHIELFSRLGINQKFSDVVFRHLGVNSFFVLSGFLITLLLIREKNKTDSIDIGAFMLRRALRIFPLYFFSIFVLFLISYFGFTKINECAFFYAITYTVNFAPTSCQAATMSHFWSLAVEEHFYLVWPFIFFINARFAFMAAIAFAGACIYFDTGFFSNSLTEYKLNRWTFPAAEPIALGCISAFLCNNIFIKRISTLQAFPWIISLGIMAQVFYSNQLLANLVITILILYIYHNQKSFLVTSLDIKPLAAIGVISYGLYVWQGVFTGNGPGNGSTPFPPHNIDIGLLITFIVAPISYWYFERPFLKIKERFRSSSMASSKELRA